MELEVGMIAGASVIIASMIAAVIRFGSSGRSMVSKDICDDRFTQLITTLNKHELTQETARVETKVDLDKVWDKLNELTLLLQRP